MLLGKPVYRQEGSEQDTTKIRQVCQGIKEKPPVTEWLYYSWYWLFLFYFEGKHAVIFNKSFEFVSYYYFSNAGRCTGKDHITDID